MSKTEVGTENIYFEMESKKETEHGTYDETTDKSKAPATKGTSVKTFAQGAEGKRQPFTDRDTEMFRRMLVITAAVVAVAFLTAVATLVLALTMMMSRNVSTASKDSTDIYAELKETRKNISYIQSLVFKISRRGYNGTQGLPGPPGPPGYNGTQRLSGSGNLALCSYKNKSSPGTPPGLYALETVQITEPEGKIFLGVNCGTNDAKLVTFSSTLSGDKRNYTCTCEKTHNTRPPDMYCYIHYWECPT